mgnify:CR=1 FL=1
MDYLDKLTQLAQVRGEINIRCLFQGDWQVEHQPDVAEYQGLFHLIEQGECWVTLAGKQFHLKKGDLFFLPQNRPHFLGSSQQKRENSLQRAQSNALFNNYKDGFINKLDGWKVIQKIIMSNPYRREVYEFLIKEDGDFSREIENLAYYLGFDIKSIYNTFFYFVT